MDGRELRAKAAITGLGISEMGRIYGHDAQHFADHVRLLDYRGVRRDTGPVPDLDRILVRSDA